MSEKMKRAIWEHITYDENHNIELNKRYSKINNLIESKKSPSLKNNPELLKSLQKILLKSLKKDIESSIREAESFNLNDNIFTINEFNAYLNYLDNIINTIIHHYSWDWFDVFFNNTKIEFANIGTFEILNNYWHNLKISGVA